MDYRQLGKFEISTELIVKRTDDVREAFRALGCVVVETETSFVRNTIRYVAVCDRFDKVPLGEMIPEYKIKVSIDSDRQAMVEVERCGEHEMDFVVEVEELQQT